MTETPFLFRRAGPADLDAALALFADLTALQQDWRIFAPRPSLMAETVDAYRAAAGDPDSLHLVVEVDGQVVAMGLARVVRPSRVSDERGVEISNVVVREEHRGRGVARAVVAELVGFARERGVERVVVEVFTGNREAMAFWQGLGFVPRVVELTARVADVRTGPPPGPSAVPGALPEHEEPPRPQAP